jgi:FixJ family two-component response regulator
LSRADQATAVVFVVDDDVSVRESVELLVRSAGYRVETFKSAEEFLVRTRPLTPTCLILDVTLPGISGLDLQKRIAADGTGMQIIFMTAHDGIPIAVRAMKAGAVEFLTKPLAHDTLLSAIEDALALSHITRIEEARTATLRQRYARLTVREREVMHWVVRGLLNKQVGLELNISEITVKAHRGKVMQKMQADSLADLVNMATRLSGEGVQIFRR